MQRVALFVLYRFEGRCCFCPSFKNSRFRSVKPALQRGTGFQREFAAELPLAGVRVAAHPVQTCRKARPRTTVAHNLMYLH
jgi:hypothetical protein